MDILNAKMELFLSVTFDAVFCLRTMLKTKTLFTGTEITMELINVFLPTPFWDVLHSVEYIT